MPASVCICTSASFRTNADEHNMVMQCVGTKDMMGYAHDAERALAKIAAINGDATAIAKWQNKMQATAASLKKYLWREEHGACFDRERDGNKSFVTSLVHNNIRAMWHGIFSQAMADTFVARHLMNTSEFWTNTPLPSIVSTRD